MRSVIISFKNGCTRKIQAIKALRAATNIDLRSAKDFVQNVNAEPLSLQVDDGDFYTLLQNINESGGILIDDNEFAKYRDSLKEIAMAAMLADDTFVAEEIIAFVNDRFKYKRSNI